jgi:hypothetical protein
MPLAKARGYSPVWFRLVRLRTVDPTQVSLRKSITRRRQFPFRTFDGERQGIDINDPGDRF